jgi:hypothetical protein
MIRPVAGFVLPGLFAVWFLIGLVRGIAGAV